LTNRRLSQLAPPEQSLRKLILSRQTLMLKRMVEEQTLAIRQENAPMAPSELMRQIQELQQHIQDLRKESRDGALARKEENA
jgi:hypothetical protein